MKFHDIKNIIAKAIEEADNQPCPEGYAASAGYLDHDWLSDWGAFIADAVVAKIEEHGLAIHGRYRCEECAKFFTSPQDKKRHKIELHTPHHKLSAKDRPANLGDVQCGYDGCNQTFANEWNAAQHRHMVHGEPRVKREPPAP